MLPAPDLARLGSPHARSVAVPTVLPLRPLAEAMEFALAATVLAALAYAVGRTLGGRPGEGVAALALAVIALMALLAIHGAIQAVLP